MKNRQNNFIHKLLYLLNKKKSYKKILACVLSFMMIIPMLPISYTIVRATNDLGINWPTTVGETVTIESTEYKYGGDISTTGLNYQARIPNENTAYKAGNGTVIFNRTTSTITLWNAEINSNNFCIYVEDTYWNTVGKQVNLELKGESTLNTTSVYALFFSASSSNLAQATSPDDYKVIVQGDGILNANGAFQCLNFEMVSGTLNLKGDIGLRVQYYLNGVCNIKGGTVNIYAMKFGIDSDVPINILGNANVFVDLQGKDQPAIQTTSGSGKSIPINIDTTGSVTAKIPSDSKEFNAIYAVGGSGANPQLKWNNGNLILYGKQKQVLIKGVDNNSYFYNNTIHEITLEDVIFKSGEASDKTTSTSPVVNNPTAVYMSSSKTANYKLTAAYKSEPQLKVYSSESGEEIANGVSAKMINGELQLTFENTPTVTEYYVAAIENGKNESHRIKMTLTIYEFPYEEPILNDNGTADVSNDDYYLIKNVGEFYWFANQVNNGETAINAKLGSDIVLNEGEITASSSPKNIWTPIGTASKQYSGNFDGQRFKISGMYIYGSNQYQGLFGATASSGTIQNVGVVNSYVKGNVLIGGIVGYNKGTIKNCYNSTIIEGSSSVGGIVGNNTGTISNCYNNATIKGSTGSAGGIIGYAGDNSNVSNSYNIGNVSTSISSLAGSICGENGASNAKFTNNYYLEGSATSKGNKEFGIGNATADVEGATTTKSLEQFKSGEVTYLLNDSKSDGTLTWGQKIGTDESPVYWKNNTVYYKDNVYSNETDTDIINVNIAWGSMEYTYTDASEGTWNPTTHKFENQSAAEWKASTSNSNEITITNESNVELTASLSYTQATDAKSVIGSFTDELNKVITSINLAIGDTTPQIYKVYLKLDGKPSETANKSKIGSVTVTIGGKK